MAKRLVGTAALLALALVALATAPASGATKAATTTVLSASASTIAFGQAAVLTATVRDGTGAAVTAGKVKFTAGSTLGTVAVDAQGKAVLSFDSLPRPSANVTAVFQGTSTTAKSTSAAVGVIVGAGSTKVSLVANRTTATAGQSVKVTATVTPVAPSTRTPAGDVRFVDGATTLGTVKVNRSGTAALTTSALGVGARQVQAVFAPADGYATASGSAAVTVSQGTSKVAIAVSPGAPVFGQATTITATVTGGGSIAATGSVRFFDGTTQIGAASLDTTGHAAFTTSALTRASHTVRAAYDGDARLSSSTKTAKVVVAKAPVTVSLDAVTAVPGQAVTLTGRVVGGAPAATGTLRFEEGSTLLGTASLASGRASVVVTPPGLAAGTHSITLTYVGDDNYLAGTGTGSVVSQGTVTPVAPTVTWSAPAAITYGTGLGAAQLNATASVPGTFVYTPAAGAVLAAGTGRTLSVTFTPTDLTRYLPVTTTVLIDVVQATPVVTWTNPAAITSGTALGAAQLNATASVAGTFAYTPPGGTVLSIGSAQSLSVTFTPTDTNYRSATKTVLIDVVAPGSTGAFGARVDVASGALPVASSLADFNRDGRLDLVVANYGAATISVLLGTSAGTFGPRATYAVGSRPSAIAIGDLNGDAKLDVLTANYAANTVSVLLGTGTGAFGAKTDVAVGAGPQALTLGDLNADGKLDLITANSTANTVSVMPGNGSGGFGLRANYSTGLSPSSVALADLNGDSRLDVVTANLDSNSISVLLGSGSGTVGAKTDYAVGASPAAVALGDINRDGRIDAVTADYDAATVSVVLGTGTGAFGAATARAVGLSPQALALADLNGDGRLDIVAANFDADSVSVLLATTTGFAAKVDYAVGAAPWSISIGDVTGDGRLDLVTANSSDDTVSVLTGT